LWLGGAVAEAAWRASLAVQHEARGQGQRATGNGQRATGNGQRATGNGQRATGNGQRATEWIMLDGACSG
jgi:hypothetical protein